MVCNALFLLLSIMEQNSYKSVLLTGVVILGVATVTGSYLISRTNFSIQNVGTATTLDGKLTNTIAVSGDGKVSAKPDMVTINVGASELAKTTKEAMAQSNAKIAEVLNVLKMNNIPDKDIQTSELSLAPEYDWSTTPRQLKGQRATQRLTVNIKGLDPQSDKVATIIDALSQINNLEMGGITYDIEDKTALFSQARELAFKKAQQKATELAKLGGVELLRPVSITDDVVNYNPPMYLQNSYLAEKSVAADGGSQLPTGQLELQIQVSVMWGIK